MKYLRGNRSLLLLALSALAMPASGWATALVYYGGPVVSNAQVVMVNWSTNVPATVQSGLLGFYGDVVQSDYWTILREYATNVSAQDGGASTNQQIGFGSFAGMFTIAPANCAGTTSCTVTTTQVAAELTSQITAGQLPAPETDAAGNVDTVYMVHFHPSVTIARGNSQSCVTFCATSINFSSGGLTVPAGIIPDQGGACAAGCGAGTYAQGETRVSSEELANLVTDPLGGSAIAVVRPLAWYDAANGQISDICSSAAIIVANGNFYTVGKLWSNQQAACIAVDNVFVVKPSAASNGSISPNALQAVNSGATTSFIVTPDAGYTAIVGGTCGGTLVDTTYTTNSITADCTVIASFIDRIFADGFEAP